jgi:glycosyltransferase involved in cell wall biosynthesis
LPTTRPKVIQLTPYYPPHLGGVERVAEALANGLCVDHDVEVWTTDLGGQAGTKTDDSSSPFPVFRLPAIELAHTPLAPGVLRKLLALPPDSIVHVHVSQALWPELVAIAAARRGFRMVAHFHLDVDPTGLAGRLLPVYKRHCLARTLRRADAVIALTQGQAAFLTEQYGIAAQRLIVAHNGVDESFLNLRRSRHSSDQPLRILFVGRLDRQKNVPRLLRALTQVPEPVEAVIVGDGEDKRECESLCRTHNLDNVRLVGPQHGKQLLGWFEWADLFVLPSDREGMPLALLEAMAAGLAVVTTDVSDLPEQVGDAGLVVPRADGYLVEAIRSLARDRTLLHILQGRSKARGHSLGWDASVAQLARLYENLPA